MGGIQAAAAAQATAAAEAAEAAAAAKAVAGQEAQERAPAKTIICVKINGKGTEYGTPGSRAIHKGFSRQGDVVKSCVSRDKARSGDEVDPCCS